MLHGQWGSVTTIKNTPQGSDFFEGFFPFLFLLDAWLKSLNHHFIVRNNSRQKKYSPDFLELTWMCITYHHNIDLKKNKITHFLFLFFIRILNTVSHSVYMAQHKHQKKLSGSMGYFAFPLMKCSNTRQAASISLQSKQSPKKEIFTMKEPQTSSVLMKMSNCSHSCSQPWMTAEFLHQNYSTTEKFWQINCFLLNKIMNCTEDERHQIKLLLNWILYGPNRLNQSGRLWETRRQHSQIQNTFFFEKYPLGSCLYFFFSFK